MKASKNNITTLFKPVLILLLIGFQSCGTYNSKTSEIENDLLNGNFDGALAGIDKSKFLTKDRNRLLYLLEKGKLEHLKGNYEKSNNLLEEAYIMIDDKIKTNVGQAISGKFTNPMAEPYKGEDFEKVTIHYYKALNYFMLGMPDEALVEAKRINIKLLEFNEKYTENKNKYTEDAFSQILQGIIYESTGDVNNAFIAYRNAEEIYNKDNGKFFGVAMPEQLKKDLLRTSYSLGFMQEYNEYLKKFNMLPAESKASDKGKKAKKDAPATPVPPPPALGEAIVFWENGLGPAKDQILITASGGSGVFYGTYMDGDVMEEILIPIPPGSNIGSINAIAIPKYRKRDSYYSKACLEVNGKEQPFELAQDFYPIAKQCLKDRMMRETINIVLRFAAKKGGSALLGAIAKEAFGDTAGDLTKLGADAAGAATEKADTRNWQSLPATISYVRVPLKEGDNKFVLKKYGPAGIDTDTLVIPFRRGLQIVNYFDLGRTQLLPVNNQETVNTMVGALSGGDKSASVAGGLIGGNVKPTSATSSTDKPATNTTTGLLGSNNNGGNLQAQSNGNSKYIPTPNYRPAPEGVTVSSIVENYLSAIGGTEKLQSITTQYMRSTSKSVYNGQASTTDVLVKISGSKNYSEVTTNGQEPFIMLVTEENAWQTMNGKRSKMDKSVAKMVRSNNKSLYESCRTPLAGNAKLEGVGTLNNEDVYGITYDVQGTKITNYYSVKSGLIVATSSVSSSYGTTLKAFNTFADYRNVNGILFPFRMQSVTDSGSTSDMVYTEVKFNEGVSDADFQ